MRIPDEIPKSVVFLGKREVKNGLESLRPRGTAFVVAVPGSTRSAPSHLYLVTARHSILRLQGLPQFGRVLRFVGQGIGPISGAGRRIPLAINWLRFFCLGFDSPHRLLVPNVPA